MSKSKLEKFVELKSFHHVIELSFKDVLNKDYYLKNNWNKVFFKNNNEIILEIGCGKGEYTIALAEKYPQKNFIGIDIKGNRIWKGATFAKQKNLSNVCFIRTHIEFIESIFSKNEISQIWLPFPDPQMKKFRKRLVSTRFLTMYLNILDKDGIIHLKTDSNFLYHYVDALMKGNNITPIFKTNDLYKNPIFKDALLIKTHYEKQFINMGIPIKFIQFKLPKYTLKETNIKIKFDTWKSYERGKKSHT